jgi:hypothetical protein
VEPLRLEGKMLLEVVRGWGHGALPGRVISSGIIRGTDTTARGGRVRVLRMRDLHA